MGLRVSSPTLKTRFGAWQNKVVGTIYQATEDGFANVIVHDGGSTCIINFKCDTFTPPTTEREAFRTSATGDNNEYSITYPVAKDEYWLASHGGSGSPICKWRPKIF